MIHPRRQRRKLRLALFCVVTFNGIGIAHGLSHRRLSRREVLTKALVGGASCLVASPSTIHAAMPPPPSEAEDILSPCKAYRIQADESPKLSPSLEMVQPSKLEQLLAFQEKNGKRTLRSGVVWLGEHHNSVSDHELQASLLRSVYQLRSRSGKSAPPLSVGLEQVQIRFQPVLNDYVAGKISEEEMLERVEWNRRWSWSFDGYRRVFQVAREHQIPLVALNVNSEDLAVVERDGFPGLTRQQIQTYIPDPVGFAEFAKPQSYKTYVDYVILPSYDLHRDLGLLRYTVTGQALDEEMPFRRFFSGRILWDEGMASAAYDWTSQHSGLMLALVGADHVKFDRGIPGRYQRLVAASSGKKRLDSLSVILNPTLIDTRPSNLLSEYASSPEAFSSQYPDQITLQLRYLKEGVDVSQRDSYKPINTGGVLPLADYILISPPEAS